MSSDEDDPFSYTPLQRSQLSGLRRSKPDWKPSRLSLSQTREKKVTKTKYTSKKSPKKLTANKAQANNRRNDANWNFLYSGAPPQAQKRKISAEKCVAQAVKKEDTLCPRCSVPWATLKTSRENHTSICTHEDLSNKPSCLYGNMCRATDSQHFWSYNHKSDTSKTWNTGPAGKGETNNEDPGHGSINGGSAVPDNDYELLSDLDAQDTQGDCQRYDSEPLFDLPEDKGCHEGRKAIRKLSSSSSHSSSNLLDTPNSLVPKVLVQNEDDQETVCFSDDFGPGAEKTFVAESPLEESGCETDIGWAQEDDDTRLDLPLSGNHRDQEASSWAPALHYDEKRNQEMDSRPTTSYCDIRREQVVSSREATPYYGERRDHKVDSIPATPYNERRDQGVISPTAVPSHGSSRVHKDNSQTKESSSNSSRDQENHTSDLQDSEGDDIISKLVETAVDHIAIPAVESIKEWREESRVSRERHTGTPRKRKASSGRCIHLHFHLEKLSTQSSKENGQTSILNYFQPTRPREKNESSCCCAIGCENKPLERKGNKESWQGLMARMQQRVEIPTVSQSSSVDTECYSTSVPLRGPKGTGKKKGCPFYKRVADTGIVVDAFNYGSIDGVEAYFLTHFHYDHYCGLRKSFNHPIYCSEITAKLVNMKLGVPLKYLQALPLWEPQPVCGVEVTLLDANHCPGAVMFLFKTKFGAVHLHVGDFRAHPRMESFSSLQQCSIHTLYLDTTYCNPAYVFPTQEKVVKKCVAVVMEHLHKNPETLIAVGAYTIGKEKVFKEIASKLDCRIWAREDKKKVLRCIKEEEIQRRLTDSKLEAKVHVLPMADIQPQKLGAYLNQLKGRYTEVVALRPTGWEFSGDAAAAGLDNLTPQQHNKVYIYGVPYSEHSSFAEMKRFVQFIKPKKIIPTVNIGNQLSRRTMEHHFTAWLREK